MRLCCHRITNNKVGLKLSSIKPVDIHCEVCDYLWGGLNVLQDDLQVG